MAPTDKWSERGVATDQGIAFSRPLVSGGGRETVYKGRPPRSKGQSEVSPSGGSKRTSEHHGYSVGKSHSGYLRRWMRKKKKWKVHCEGNLSDEHGVDDRCADVEVHVPYSASFLLCEIWEISMIITERDYAWPVLLAPLCNRAFQIPDISFLWITLQK